MQSIIIMTIMEMFKRPNISTVSFNKSQQKYKIDLVLSKI
jgi:hypothetical protein